MERLKIKNFGPIREGYKSNNGFIDINDCTVFIGEQGSGKSSIAKIYSLLLWLEKDFKSINSNRSYSIKTFKQTDFDELCREDGLCDYFSSDTEIEYIGSTYKFKIKGRTFLKPEKLDSNSDYIRPKIMYIPSERNVVSVLRQIGNIANIPATLRLVSERYLKAFDRKKNYKLPLRDLKLSFNRTNGDVELFVSDDKNISISVASSGIQSISPLIVITQYLSDEVESDVFLKLKKLGYNDKKILADKIKSELDSEPEFSENLINSFMSMGKVDTNYTEQEEVWFQNIFNSTIKYMINNRFVNVVEEPEQNLYPESQKSVIFELLRCYNRNYNARYIANSKNYNKLILTTHSPYIIPFLTLSSKAYELYKKIDNSSLDDRARKKLSKRIERIVPYSSAVAGDKITIYKTNVDDGTVTRVENYMNIPSSDNSLNNLLIEQDESFSDLIDIQQELI